MQDRPFAAAGSVLAAMALIGFIDQFVRLVAEQSSLWTFHALRSVAIWALVGIWLAVAGRRLRVVSWRGVAGRSAVISTAMILYFGALGFLPVAQVAAGLFTAPLWILLIRRATGHAVGATRLAVAALGFLGVLLVLSPDPSALSAMLLVPVVAGAFYGVGALATRAWCGAEDTLTLVMGVFTAMGLWGLGGILLAGGEAGFLARGWVAPDARTCALIAMQAAGSLVAVILLTRGYQLAEASVASVFEYSVLGFSALFGWLVWGDVLGPAGLAGLAIIAAAGAAMARYAEPEPERAAPPVRGGDRRRGV